MLFMWHEVPVENLERTKTPDTQFCYTIKPATTNLALTDYL